MNTHLYRNCRKDAERLCNAPKRWYKAKRRPAKDENETIDNNSEEEDYVEVQRGVVFSCLYHHDKYYSKDLDKQVIICST